MVSLRDACAVLPRAELTPEGVDHARHGRPIGAADVKGESWRAVPMDRALVLFEPGGEPVAIARRTETGLRVARGFTTSAADVVSR
jgi:hypothetical protein